MLKFDFEESQAMLNEFGALDAALQDKALHYILGQAASPVLKEIRGHAPVKSGALKESLGRKKLNKKERRYNFVKTGVAAIGIGATRNVVDDYMFQGKLMHVKRSQAFKLRFIEEGTNKHRLYKGVKAGVKARFQSVYINGRWFKKSSVMHSGARKNPFMTRTYKQHENQIPDRTITALKKWLQKNAARQNPQ